MVRARPCFQACFLANGIAVTPGSSNSSPIIETPDSGDTMMTEQSESGHGNKEHLLFSETLVAEDADLGARLHHLGYKATMLREPLAEGEVRTLAD